MQKENYFILLIKGFIIGIGKILPGISGAMIAFSLGLYQECLEKISNITKKFWTNINYLFPIVVGILIGIALGSNVIILVIRQFYLSCMLFFTGLILGDILSLYKELPKKKQYFKYFIITFLTIILIGIIKPSSTTMIFRTDINTFVILITIGLIEALSMIIPGLSGTALMILIGCYEPLLNIWGNIFNINTIKTNIFILIPFTIGLIIGIIVLSKLMTKLFKNHYTKTMYSILGFSLGSIVLLYLKTITVDHNIQEISIGLILFIIGTLITKKYSSRIKTN